MGWEGSLGPPPGSCTGLDRLAAGVMPQGCNPNYSWNLGSASNVPLYPSGTAEFKTVTE